jgi:hypothetical protein
MYNIEFANQTYTVIELSKGQAQRVADSMKEDFKYIAKQQDAIKISAQFRCRTNKKRIAIYKLRIAKRQDLIAANQSILDCGYLVKQHEA